MADIRINALATTAASTASDDFVAVDGSANGTRKLNAYSPTFGGNLTLSGTTSTITLGSTNTGSIAVDANGALIVTPKAGQYTTLSVSGNSGLFVNNGTTQIYLGNSGGNAVAGTLNANDFLLIRDGAVKLTATATGVHISGNLTVSGTGTSSVAGKLQLGATTATGYNTLLESSGITTGRGVYQITSNGAWLIAGIEGSVGGTSLPGSTAYASFLGSFTATPLHLVSNGTIGATLTSGGNFLIGTTTDGGQKLQVSGTAYVSGNLSSDARITAGTGLTATSTVPTVVAASTNLDYNSVGAKGRLFVWGPDAGTVAAFELNLANSTNSSLITALSFDSSGNATFAGATTILGKSLNTESVSLQIGDGRTGNGYTWIDLVGDATYTDYGLRVVRGNAGANATSSLKHRGTGTFDITAEDAANVTIATSNTTRMTVKSDGKINFASLPTSSAGLSTGDIWNDGGTLKIV